MDVRTQVLSAEYDAHDIVTVLHGAGPGLYRHITPPYVRDIGGTWFGARDTEGVLCACLWALVCPNTAYLDYLASVKPGAGVHLLRAVVQSFLPLVGVSHLKATISTRNRTWARIVDRLAPGSVGRTQVWPVHVQLAPYATQEGGPVGYPPEGGHVAHGARQGPSGAYIHERQPAVRGRAGEGEGSC